MGPCLSCLGLGRKPASDSERTQLLYADDPYSSNYGYGSNHISPGIPPQNLMSADEVRREQEAMDNITQWATDQVVEIFPHSPIPLMSSSTMLQGDTDTIDTAHDRQPQQSAMAQAQARQDILLSMIPGDKSKRGSIRIYPASLTTTSRPTSAIGNRSIRSKHSHSGLNGNATKEDEGEGVLVKMKIDLP